FANLLAIDELYAVGYIGPVDVTFGMHKLNWGKADSNSILDVVNTQDYSSMLNMTEARSDTNIMKIANVMLDFSAKLGNDSRLELVYVPTFEPWHFATSGKWMQAAQTTMMKGYMTAMGNLAINELPSIFQGLAGPYIEQVLGNFDTSSISLADLAPDTTSLKFGQVGLRFTTTVGPVDIGTQYYFGYKAQPAVDMTGVANALPAFISSATPEITQAILSGKTIDEAINSVMTPDKVKGLMDKVKVVYNPYHQVGFDAATALGPVNMRAELATNLTYDLKGNDPAVYNPNIAWTLGADYTIPKINVMLNAQATETIILLYDKIDTGSTSIDAEVNSKPTSTMLTFSVSRNFFNEKLGLEFNTVYEIEQEDCLLMPSVTWTQASGFTMKLCSGIFLGNENGQFGQYKDNTFIRFDAKYMF
ncbi:MAG: hypothetical protein LBM77_11245, partial [Spirochaetaceae bacterium]|nr:hypothetical protein [Spirochaetaceae bacterium]